MDVVRSDFELIGPACSVRAIDFCKVDAVGLTPIRSTELYDRSECSKAWRARLQIPLGEFDSLRSCLCSLTI